MLKIYMSNQYMSSSQEYLDISLLNPENVIIHEKWIYCDGHENLDRKIGLMVDGKYHKYCGFNQFTKDSYPIPSQDDGWQDKIETFFGEFETDKSEKQTVDEYMKERIEHHRNWIKECMCDPTAKIFSPSIPHPFEQYKDFKLWKTLDNYSVGFCVLILDNIVHIYGRTLDVVLNDYDETTIFDTFIKTYNALEVFIGTSVLNKMTKFSGGYGSKWDGNSILLRIDDDTTFRYVYIGTDISEFVTDEKITAYVSSVGNNCVPYPYAESEKWVYDMSCMQKSAIEYHSKRHKRGDVFDVDDAEYKSLEYTKIAERNTDIMRYVMPATEKTCIVRLSGPVTLINNSCDDQSLPLVRQVQKYFRESKSFGCCIF
jgi:hypothetical protein